MRQGKRCGVVGTCKVLVTLCLGQAEYKFPWPRASWTQFLWFWWAISSWLIGEGGNLKSQGVLCQGPWLSLQASSAHLHALSSHNSLPLSGLPWAPSQVSALGNILHKREQGWMLTKHQNGTVRHPTICKIISCFHRLKLRQLGQTKMNANLVTGCEGLTEQPGLKEHALPKHWGHALSIPPRPPGHHMGILKASQNEHLGIPGGEPRPWHNTVCGG